MSMFRPGPDGNSGDECWTEKANKDEPGGDQTHCQR